MTAADPIKAILAASDGAVMAVIAGVEGPSYRPLGAMMAVLGNGTRVGSLSSGCIEADITLQAAQARDAGTPRMIRYGIGSPFVDIALPCGGGLDILLLPARDLAVWGKLATLRADRQVCSLHIALDSGALSIGAAGPTQRGETSLDVQFIPPIRFVIFGKGPEASTFASLVRSAGYDGLLLSPDAETRAIAAAQGCPVQAMVGPSFSNDVAVDARTAITLFFHDHDWEPPILLGTLQTPAFYIGAQGSQKARDRRHAQLRRLGLSDDRLQRLHGPVGLISSARDASTLAVSVLAEVLEIAMKADD